MGKVVEKLDKTGFTSPFESFLGIPQDKMITLMEMFASVMADEVIKIDEPNQEEK